MSDPLSDLVDCPSCKALNPPDGRFCEECGFDLVKQQRPPAKPVRKTRVASRVECSVCGTPNPRTAKTCAECGEDLSSRGYGSEGKRDRQAEAKANRALRRALTTVSMLRMAYVMGALPAAILLFLHGSLVLAGSQRGYVLFMTVATGLLLAWHVAAIILIKRFPFAISLVSAVVQTISCVFYFLFATSLFALVVPPIIALIYWGGVVPMIQVYGLLRDNPDAWAARKFR